MEKLIKYSRYVLGLIYFVFGLVGLLNLIPPPPDMPAALQTFMGGMMAAPYFFPVLKGTETIAGLLLLIGIAPALMLVILAPITLQIVLVHAFLTPDLKSQILPILMLVLHLASAKYYWHMYKPLFSRG